MREICFFRTYSLGGMEGRNREIRNFETIELAKENALNDTWNDNFQLYGVKLIFDGKITETETFLENLVCGRDLQRKKYQDETGPVLRKRK